MGDTGDAGAYSIVEPPAWRDGDAPTSLASRELLALALLAPGEPPLPPQSAPTAAAKRFGSLSIVEDNPDLRAHLAKAERLLRETERLVTDIALSCGVASTSYFCRVVKRVHGVSPAALRRPAS